MGLLGKNVYFENEFMKIENSTEVIFVFRFVRYFDSSNEPLAAAVLVFELCEEAPRLIFNQICHPALNRSLEYYLKLKKRLFLLQNMKMSAISDLSENNFPHGLLMFYSS